ncbi:putative 5-Methylcytosine G/T mismatch-specific DNA glycosylase [Cladophialophora carrionii]|uniref:Putative 5-Methylcytosine G/T mismatch-specific DNA glycosylase n=1 Tax=Cladophialophora carrionii TaxID=86049 RepID=A0A1C1CDS3_9EURO|nr:putative 5-Methylcytosine G/T mismatch-specific DNA glycosylase [Cladophialophora carrionii]
MPSKVRDSSAERRREKKESSRIDKDRRDRDRERTRDRDRDKDKDKDREKHRSSRKASTKEKTSSRTSISPVDEKRRSSMPGKIDDGSLKSESKSSLPYPSLSKEHARETLGLSHRPNLVNPFTPPATDLNASKDKLPSSKPSTTANNAPPSPPLTEKHSGTGKWKPNAGKPVSVETIQEEKGSQTNGDSKATPKVRTMPKTRAENGHLRSTSELGTNSSPTRKPRDMPGSNLKTSTPVSTTVPQRSVSQPTRTDSPATATSATSATGSGTNLSSEATSIAPEQPNIQRPGSKIPPAAIYPDGPAIILPQSRGVTPMEVFIEDDESVITGTPGGVSQTPGPPPPPPPPVPITVPKVDYLLQHGGLHHSVPKNLLLAGKPMAIQQAQSPGQQPIVVANLFEPYIGLLDDFEKVISKNGSLAVATGYRSVARRLLDRLEAVFARDISSEACQCPMCEYDGAEDVRGVSWGEVLELVSGRKDWPAWPPFTFTQSPVGLGISLELHVPMQQLDIDVPEEYRDHYIRQSRKTKQSVDKWLNRQGDNPTSPPEEVDDETLTFAILTHLPAEQRPIFKDLLGIVDRPLEPPKRVPTPELEKHSGAPRPPVPTPTPTPAPRARQPHIAVALQAIQRLYRLNFQPRDSEAALFLLNNPSLHNALATLAAISNDEWDILISGRFDGFLRSGAEDVPLPEHLPPSRGPTPYRPPTRGTTPGYGPPHVNGAGYGSRQGSYSGGYGAPSAQYGAPIAFDEETELATLAEIERDIYAGMEALEDAFEALHNKAEVVRRALRERSAGLAAAAQRRRGAMGGGIEVRMNTPASGILPTGEHGFGRWDAETDDGLGEWEGLSEIAPDDSASNISSSRRRRPKRRNERRTPALIEEEDEFEDGVSEGTASPKKR